MSKKALKVIEVSWPMSRDLYQAHDPDDDGRGERITKEGWRPGTYDGGDIDRDDNGDYVQGVYVSDAMGAMLLTKIGATDRNGPYCARVIFVRQWRDPQGRVFGKRTVRMCSLAKWQKLLAGFTAELVIDDRGPLLKGSS